MGQNYTDCNDLLGNPSNGTGYNQTMADDAAREYGRANGGSGASWTLLGTVSIVCGGSAVAGSLNTTSGQNVIIWVYSGPFASVVHTETLATFQANGNVAQCPAASDPSWT